MTATATRRRRVAVTSTGVDPARHGEEAYAPAPTPDEPPSAEAGAPRQFGIFDWTSPTPVYLGVALVVLGFAVIAYAWARVAGEDSVALQLPYITSGGVGGLGIVLVGLTMINVTTKHRDAAERQREFAMLTEILDRVAAALDRGQCEER